MPPRTRMRYGFSLVELSIVLVILGLLIGGVLSGQSLIRAAELRAVVSEEQRYFTAVASFRDKYFAVPGDMTNATAFWGYMGGTGCTNSSGTAITTPGTCDGNGDGFLGQAAAANQSGELYQFWRQLAQAGLIEGTYSGIISGAGPAWNYADYLTNNSPASRMSNARWGNSVFDNTTGNNVQYFSVDYRNWFIIFSTNIYPGSALAPGEAWNIDKKIDDGLPGQGSVKAYYYGNCTDAIDGTMLSAQYTLSTVDKQCMLAFKL